MAGYHDIITYKGSAFRYHFKLMDEDENGVDLSSTSAKMQVKRSPFTEDNLLDFSAAGVTINYFGLTGTTFSSFSPTGTGGIKLNNSYLGVSGDTGGIYVSAPSNIMANMPVGNWVYSLVVKISGNDENLVQGKFMVEWNPTT